MTDRFTEDFDTDYTLLREPDYNCEPGMFDWQIMELQKDLRARMWARFYAVFKTALTAGVLGFFVHGVPGWGMKICLFLSGVFLLALTWRDLWIRWWYFDTTKAAQRRRLSLSRQCSTLGFQRGRFPSRLDNPRIMIDSLLLTIFPVSITGSFVWSLHDIFSWQVLVFAPLGVAVLSWLAVGRGQITWWHCWFRRRRYARSMLPLR